MTVGEVMKLVERHGRDVRDLERDAVPFVDLNASLYAVYKAVNAIAREPECVTRDIGPVESVADGFRYRNW